MKFGVVDGVSEDMDEVVPEVDSAIEDQPVLLDTLGQFEAFFVVFEKLFFLLGDLGFLLLAGWFFILLFVDSDALLEGDFEILVGKLVDFDLTQKV